MAMVKLDHASISAGSDKPVRVYHPHATTIDASVEFTAAPDGGTVVTWSGNSILPVSTKILVGGWPFLVLIPIVMGALSRGVNFTEIIPIALIFFFTSMMMMFGMNHNAGRLDASLVNYFQNCQTLDEIEKQKQMKLELEQLREKAATSPAAKAPAAHDDTLRSPIPELHENEDTDEDQPDAQRPPDTRLRQ